MAICTQQEEGASSVEKYSPLTNKWIDVPAMKRNRRTVSVSILITPLHNDNGVSNTLVIFVCFKRFLHYASN
ncbi:hypothetical protein COOONC_26664 [Cooperia oncophora]